MLTEIAEAGYVPRCSPTLLAVVAKAVTGLTPAVAPAARAVAEPSRALATPRDAWAEAVAAVNAEDAAQRPSGAKTASGTPPSRHARCGASVGGRLG